jgi:putative spermidine/putrescine transport system ATP-binding protein
MTGALALEGISKRFAGHDAVADLSLSIMQGELVVLLGPSGCGKTTTLRMIAGFVQPTTGDILLAGNSLLDVAAHQREMGIVFQSYALFPHLTVARNIAFGLEMRKLGKGVIAARVDEILRMVKLEAFATRLPRHLSGGQQQRVALARALAIHPRVLLLDEPLSNLDAALRLEMAREIRLLQQQGGITTVMVTHDQAEAMAMADRLVVMRDGRVQQVGRPEDLYERPVNPFVAGFIGGSNILAGRLESDRLLLPGGGAITLTGHAGTGPATLALRPEVIRVAVPAGVTCIEGVVELCTYLGTTIEHAVRIDADTVLVTRGPAIGVDAARRHVAGTRVALSWSSADERLFDAQGQPMPVTVAREATQGEHEWTS